METEPDVELGAFSDPGARATPWASARAILDEAEIFWLSTVRPDGRPHVTPLLAARALGALCFVTGGQERKALNLDSNSHCALTTGTGTLNGVDLVVEGLASAVGERSERERAMADFARKYGAHLTDPEGTWYGMGAAVVAGDVRLYRIEPTRGFAFAKLPVFSQTRYTWQGR
ncbi:pyridoxamine 5'-phosphate oxidase family protein [Streptomyces sp. NPDC088923]|uniref:pyridoxamine 5'-phosphate oxidase family protein n=1 Tax=Streptomyces sp. NPDC088923 TaxID=3365913 RepID=UPI0037F2A444